MQQKVDANAVIAELSAQRNQALDDLAVARALNAQLREELDDNDNGAGADAAGK